MAVNTVSCYRYRAYVAIERKREIKVKNRDERCARKEKEKKKNSTRENRGRMSQNKSKKLTKMLICHGRKHSTEQQPFSPSNSSWSKSFSFFVVALFVLFCFFTSWPIPPLWKDLTNQKCSRKSMRHWDAHLGQLQLCIWGSSQPFNCSAVHYWWVSLATIKRLGKSSALAFFGILMTFLRC